MVKAVPGVEWALAIRSKRRLVQVVLLILVFLLAVAFATQSYLSIDEDLTAATLSRRHSVSFLAAATLTEKFDRLIDIGTSLATRTRFRELVVAQRWADAMELFKAVPRQFPFIDRMVLFDPAGTIMADVPVIAAVKGLNFADREWYAAVSEKWQPHISNAFARNAEPRFNVIVVAVPVHADPQQVAGILLLQVKLDAILDWLREVDFGESGLLYVVDRHGIVASHPMVPPQETLRDASMIPAVQKALRGERGVEILFDPFAAEERVVAYAPIPRYGWAVIAEQPKSAAFAAKNKLLADVVVAYALILVLFGGVTYLIAHVVAEREQGDVARRAKAELEQRVAERTAELQAANRELESFSYSVSHDLRVPLRVIDGFARLLEDDYRDRLDVEAQRRIHIIRTNSEKMAQLIDNLLEFAHTGRRPMKATDIDMTGVARQVAAELSSSPDPPVRWAINSLPDARGDPALMRQVWMNLVSNALKFTAKKADRSIEIGGHRHDSEAVFYVKDNGVGFDMAHYDKLFGVFQRLHNTHDYAGSGVGLAIVQRIVERHGGRVWANGKVGEGATFHFALPAPPTADAHTNARKDR